MVTLPPVLGLPSSGLVPPLPPFPLLLLLLHAASSNASARNSPVARVLREMPLCPTSPPDVIRALEGAGTSVTGVTFDANGAT